MWFGRGQWIQYRAYTLTFWSAIVLTFPHFMHDSMFAHRHSQNPHAMFLIAALALAANAALSIYHFYRVFKYRRNPLTQEVYSDTPTYITWVHDTATPEAQDRIAARLGKTPEEVGYR